MMDLFYFSLPIAQTNKKSAIFANKDDTICSKIFCL